MSAQKKIIAIIPARSGSKGLKDKNIKLLNGKPLIAYTIQSALESEMFDEIIVSTDSEEYAGIARKYGAKVPFLREGRLATDNATSEDVIEDVLKKMKDRGKEFDYFMLLQPTSPLRTSKNICESINLLYEKQANAIVSMCECEHPTKWNKELSEDRCLDGLFFNVKRRQEEKKTYRLNGAIYIANVSYFLEYKSFYKKNSFAYIMKQNESIDIDNLYDFKYAELVMQDKCEKYIGDGKR